MYYFLKSVEEKKKIRVIALPGQKFPDGTEVDPKFKVSFQVDKRIANPVGTIFITASLRKVYKSGSVSYYSTSSWSTYVFDPTAKSHVDAFMKTFGVTLEEYSKSTTAESKEEESTKVDEEKKEGLKYEIECDKTLAAPSSSKDGFYVNPTTWKTLVRNVKKHINTMIIGPTGCGKTSCVKELCDRLGLKLHIFDMGAMVDPISSLLGVHRLEKGESIFDYAKFTQVIKEPCVILLDELSRAAYSTMNILFPCLDDRRTLDIEIATTKGERRIKIHPEVTFIATANVGAEYTGTNSMDRALVNRFFPIELGNISGAEEEKVLIKRTGISTDEAKLIVKITNNIRSLADKQEISCSLSIRESLMAASMVADGWGIGEALEMIYLPLYEGTKTSGERSTVYKTISSY